MADSSRTDAIGPLQGLRLLFVVNNVAFFVSHRLAVALAARASGATVALATGVPGSVTMEQPAIEALRAARVEHLRATFTSGGTSPLKEMLGWWQLWRRMKQWRPDIVHCVTPKGVLYGGLAARLSGVHAAVFAVSGMGFLFTHRPGWRVRLLRGAYRVLLGLALGQRQKRVIVQNQDDRRAFLEAGLVDDGELRLIPGSGVDLREYAKVPGPQREKLVVLPARMLRDKGVHEFAQAAMMLRASGCDWRFALVGAADYDNPSAVSRALLEQWQQAGGVEWWGHRDDMPAIYCRARIVCLPSYREGMPKSLLEGAAAGCAVVTTDAIGCREAIVPGVTGDLVGVGDAQALASALGSLINDEARCAAYGAAGREWALARFDLQSVIRATVDLYLELGATDANNRQARAPAGAD